MKFRLSILMVLIASFFTSIHAQENIDTLMFDNAELKQTEENIDSLLSLWYIKASLNSDSNMTVNEYVNIKLDTPDSVYIKRLNNIHAVMPLTYNQNVKKWIELYLKRGKYLIPTLVGLSDYYFPIFEEQLDAKGLPLELKYLPIIESALNPRAVSRAGATGLWQFMYGTGKMYNLEITTLVDDRRDPIKSTTAAINYLKDLHSIYNDWTLVIAAYNCGPGNVNKAIKRAKGKTNYWDIYPYLPKETRGYVPAFIAAAYIMNYYTEHNVYPIKVNVPIFTDTIMINEKLHLMQVSDVLKIPIEQLRDMNPQYRKDIIPADNGLYSLRLPFEHSTRFIELKDSIFAFNDSLYFNPKNATIEPPEYSASKYYDDFSPCSPPSTAGKTKIIYTVKQGDNYGFIANWFNVNVRDLKCWNNSFSNKISVGQKVVVYVPTKRLQTYEKIDQMTFDQKQELINKNAVINAVASNQKLDENYIYYTIKAGDNLSTIAKKYSGLSDKDIIAINNFSDSDIRKLQIGQIIKIKKK